MTEEVLLVKKAEQDNEDKDYYTEQEVRALLTRVTTDAEQAWKDFCNWMWGQTGPVIDGKFCYYTWDVDRYIRHLERTGKNDCPIFD